MNAPSSDIISVVCPSCGKGLNLHRRAIGIEGHCVHCSTPMKAVEREVGPGKTVIVAESPTPPAPAAFAPEEPPSAIAPIDPVEVPAETIAETSPPPPLFPPGPGAPPANPAPAPSGGPITDSPFGSPPPATPQSTPSSSPSGFAAPFPTTENPTPSPFSELFPSPATTGTPPAPAPPIEPATPAQEPQQPVDSVPAVAPPVEKPQKAKKVKPPKPVKVRRNSSVGWLLKLIFGLICLVVAVIATRHYVPKSMFEELRESATPLIEVLPSGLQSMLGVDPSLPEIPTVAPLSPKAEETEPNNATPEASPPTAEQTEDWSIPAPQRIEAFGEKVVRSFYSAPNLTQRMPFLLNHNLVEAEVTAFYKRSKDLPKLRSITPVGPMHDPTSDRWFGVYDVREHGNESRHRWCVVEVRPGEYKIDWPLYQQLADDALPKFLSDPAAPDREFTLLVRRGTTEEEDDSPVGPNAKAITLQMPLDSRPGRILQVSEEDYTNFNLDTQLVGQSAKIVRLQLGWRSLPGKPSESFPAIQRIYGWGAWESEKFTLAPK